ncbi:D-alanine---D-serine ligase [Amphibacillus marinus]|uniref:D-alanine--D-alanine ligase n=2 Tax=Amphibacillus marinus TaxID=872970 RepID=A0A1H8JS24_9BACI|nr:D-alanine---D-serine ligase [Amphibacillus marinus]
MKKTVAIIFGGYSEEYDVSLQSASAIINGVNQSEFDLVLIGITREGEWLKYDGSIEGIRQNTWWQDKASCSPAILSPDRKHKGVLINQNGQLTVLRIDVAFPILHGKNGEDGTIQGLLELAGIPYVGCSTISSALCMDKELAHKLVKIAGIEVTPSLTLYQKPTKPALLKQIEPLNYPLFVKPVNAGSSFGITKVMAENELEQAVKFAFKYDNKVVIEQGVEGFEVGCAVLGNDTLTIGQVDEIELVDGFFDYTEKYSLKTAKIHMPARITNELATEIKETAEQIYRALGCTGFARVDMFLTPEKKIVFNEVNTIPGFSEFSRYPNMLKGIGMSFEDIVKQLLELALQA